jgi:hypothetical protein
MKKRTTKTTDPLDGPVDFARFTPVRRRAFAGAGEPGGPSLRRGRPARGERRPSSVRSVRLPEALWKDVERAARAKRLNVQQALRAALLGWIRRAG